jgi:Abortive infection C-terminus
MHPAAIRKLLAEIISDEKAYDVPSICSNIGLPAGEEQEAFSSKFRYAKKRLDALDSSELYGCADKLSKLIESPRLAELLANLAAKSPSDEVQSLSLAALQADFLSQRWTNALERRESDPEGAITLARTLIEDVCKVIIVELNSSFSEEDDLPKLYRKTSSLLNLAPDQHTEQIFKQILGSCQSIVESLGAVRNKLSDAHSVGPLRARPTSRHAKLAVNLAGTMATFLSETFIERKP